MKEAVVEELAKGLEELVEALVEDQQGRAVSILTWPT